MASWAASSRPASSTSLTQRRRIDVKDSRRLFLRKSLDRDQQERLARLGRYLAEIAFRREVASHRIGGAINGKRIPDRRKQPKQGNSQQVLRIQQTRILDQRLKRGCDIGVTGSLTAGQGTGIAAQVGKIAGLRHGLWTSILPFQND